MRTTTRREATRVLGHGWRARLGSADVLRRATRGAQRTPPATPRHPPPVRDLIDQTLTYMGVPAELKAESETAGDKASP